MRVQLKKSDICFCFLLIGVFLIHLSRIQMGYASPDESFYLTIPYRLAQGDSLLVDEWHTAQLLGFILFPFMKLYLMIRGNTDGIYLAFRYIYLIVLILSSMISYIFLRRRDNVLAVVASIMLVLFVPFNVRTMGYNQLGLLAVWMLCVVSLTKIRFYRCKYVIIGILLGITVLCNPYMIILYLVYIVVCFIKKGKKDVFWSLKSLLLVTIGGILLALLIGFLLSRVSVADILANIPYIFQDPSHKTKTFWEFFKPVVDFVIWFKLYFVFFLMGSVIMFTVKRFRRVMFQCLILLQAVMWILLCVFKSSGVGKNAIMLPIALLGIVAFAMTKEKDWELFSKGWLIGILYAMCMNLSSNQGIYVICNACAVSSAVSLFMIKDYLDEEKGWEKRMWWFSFLFGMQLLAEVWINVVYVFWEEDVSSLTAQIEVGPQKGLYTTEQKKEIYEINYENIKSLGDLEGKYFVCFNSFPSGYLIVEGARNGGLSAWLGNIKCLSGEGSEQFQQYYEVHPEKKPDVIYIDIEASCTWNEKEWNIWCEENGYTKNYLFGGGIALYCME